MVNGEELKHYIIEHFKQCISKDQMEVDVVDTNAYLCKLIDHCDRRGRWVDGKCSHCGNLIPESTVAEHLCEDDMAYCPWCGYEMEDE